MTFLVTVIRDHYMLYCNHDGKKDRISWDKKISDMPKDFSLIFLNSCGMMSTGYFNENRMCTNCPKCDNRYTFDKKDEKIAKNLTKNL